MPEYKYLIIGGGMTADAAVAGIREIDRSGSIGIISTEHNPPYNRPPLSKALWKGEPFDNIWRTASRDNVSLHLARTATSLNRASRKVTDDRGTSYTYETLLLATGCSVRRLGQPVEGVIYFRTVEDYQHLRKLTDSGGRFAVIGGGFIGSEIAAALAINGMSVSLIFAEHAIGERIFPPALALFVTSYYASKGVEILNNESVTRLSKSGQSYFLTTSSGRDLKFDGIIAGIGVVPNVNLAHNAGLSVENGVVVDEFLRTSDASVYAAGDVASFYSPALGKRMRVEHEDNANTMGRIAGRNMAGADGAYHHLPFFYSDLFDLGYEAVGEINSRLETVEDWKVVDREGVIYYMEGGRVRGVLLWNTWGQVDAARALIAEKGPFTPQSISGWLPA